METLKEMLWSGEAKSIGCDWYISDKGGVWNIVNFKGTDAVSINLSKVINYELFTEHFYEMSYDHLVSFIENKCNVEKDRKFLISILLSEEDVMNKDEAVGFTVHIGSNVYELHRGCTSWSVFENGEEVFEGEYRRALQIVVNRIGYGDIH